MAFEVRSPGSPCRIASLGPWIQILLLIGAICLLLGFAAGQWWFAAGSATVVGVVVAITTDVEVSSAVLGVLAGLGVFVALFLGTVLRWGVDWIIGKRRSRASQRQ
jgi:hypothetical protein